tara:strand:+ start:493 stop:822 length:330 start_codon:yes stop_codon:yes gene_type:complete
MSDVKVGRKYRLTFSADGAIAVTAVVRHENATDWTSVSLTKEEVGDGYRDIWVGDYLVGQAGWYYVVFKTNPIGGESATKFRASKTGLSSDGASVGTIRSVTSSIISGS